MKIRIPSIETAVKALRPNVQYWDFYIRDGVRSMTLWEDPSGSDPPTWEEIDLQIKKDTVIWNYYEYARKREDLYGDIGDQLEMLYNDIKSGNLSDGEWVNHIESVKKQIPKPSKPRPNTEEWTIEDFEN